MRNWPLIAAILLSLGLVALTCAAAAAQASSGDAAIIRQRMAQWVDGYNRSDTAAILDVLSQDYVEDTQGKPDSSDKQEMAQAIDELFVKYRTHVVCVMDQVYTTGDMAFDRGHYSITYIPKAGGPAITRSGRYMEIWRLQDGVWRVRYETNIPKIAAGPVAVM